MFAGAYDGFGWVGQHAGRGCVDAGDDECVDAGGCLCIRNTMCGLLHCSGGSSTPLVGYNQTFSKTVVHNNDKQYECK